MSTKSMQNVSDYVDCSELLSKPEALRQAANQRGYLYFRCLIPVEDILLVRREVLQVAERHQLLDPVARTEEGIAREGVFVSENDPDDRFKLFYNDVQKLRSFHAFGQHPVILQVLDQLFGETVLVHPRHICHTVFPGGKKLTTPPHQDFFPVRGTQQTWTVWTPLGDCGEELGGGLGFVIGSNRPAELLDHDMAVMACEVDDAAEWAWSPMKSGDVIMFNSLTIHQARDNETDNRIRLSTSFRNQPASQPVDEHTFLPHMRWLSWEKIYADWPADDPLKYYWKKLDLDIQPHWRGAENVLP